MLKMKMATMITGEILPKLFNNDIALFNKAYQIYNNINKACNAKLFHTIPMGYIYFLVIAGAFAPLIGTMIGNTINDITRKENQ